MSHSLEGKVIAITGAAADIGREISKAIAARGAKVPLSDLASQRATFSALEEEIGATGGIASARRVEIRNEDAVNNWIAETVDTFETLDGAGNVAAVMPRNMYSPTAIIADLETDDWKHVIDTSLTGTMFCVRAELQNIADYGSIINISSLAGVMGYANIGPYVVSKHGIIGLTRTAAKEVKKVATSG